MLSGLIIHVLDGILDFLQLHVLCCEFLVVLLIHMLHFFSKQPDFEAELFLFYLILGVEERRTAACFDDIRDADTHFGLLGLSLLFGLLIFLGFSIITILVMSLLII